MAKAFPDDPNVLLLQGHIQVELECYEEAQEKYIRVLQLSERQDMIECAEESLAQIRELIRVLSVNQPKITVPATPRIQVSSANSQILTEVLPGGVKLELVKIPAGNFLMGSGEFFNGF